ncbi:MAG TPA: hypothetical protein VGD75_03885 [Bradyrhizobium sp.]
MALGHVSGLITGSDFLDFAAATLSRSPSPNEAERRRAVSGAYYGLFHTITQAAASSVAAGHLALQRQISRVFNHSIAKQTCIEFAKLSPSRKEPLKSLLPTSIDPRLMLVARYFPQVQDARERADYDLQFPVTQSFAIERVRLAQDAAQAFFDVRHLPETTVFPTALLLGDRWNRRG